MSKARPIILDAKNGGIFVLPIYWTRVLHQINVTWSSITVVTSCMGWFHVWGNFMFTCLHTSQIRWHFTNFFTKEIRPDIEVLVRPSRVLLVVIHSSSRYSNLNWENRIFTRDCGSIGFQQFIDIQNCVKKFFNFSLNFQQLLGCLEKWKSSSSFIRIITLKLLALVVRRLDSTIH